MGKTARGITTGIPRAAEREAAAVTRRSIAGRVRVVHEASVVHAAVIARVLVGIAVELEGVRSTATVDVARSNLKVAEARRHNGRAARLSTVVKIDGDVVGGSVTETIWRC